MASLSVLLIGTLTIPSLVLAAPPPLGSGTFTVSQVRNTNYVKHGPLALAHAYRKYGVTLPDDLAAAVANIVQKRETGSETTTPEKFDVAYLTPVSIGNPPQVLNLNLDTGSSDLWVFSTELPSSSINGQTTYDPSKSNTSEELRGYTWDIQYADNSTCNGNVYLDRVTVGGLTVIDQAVEAAKQVSKSFTDSPNMDGLVGLAFSSINTVTPVRQKTFLDKALEKLDLPVLTADLRHDSPGKYNFGFIDRTAYNGELFYTPVDNSDGFWTFTSPGFITGSGNFNETPITGIADTGTTLLLLPADVVSAYYDSAPGAKYSADQAGWVLPCKDAPDFAFRIGDESVIVPGSYISFAPIAEDGITCYGGIQSKDSHDVSIFGDVALKAAFVVFDVKVPQLGWAAKSLT